MNAADTAWVLVSAALVMFMTPGLALFYGGMLRAKSVLNTMALTVACLGVISVIWVSFGFSLGFGPDAGHEGLIGDLSESGLRNLATVTTNTEGHHIPTFALAPSSSCSRSSRSRCLPGPSPSAPASGPSSCSRRSG